MIKNGKGGQRSVQDVISTRYACYRIAQNGDPKKEEILQPPDQKKYIKRTKKWQK